MQYGTVTGRILATIADRTTDADQAPDTVPVTGTVRFTPSVSSAISSTEGAIIMPTPIDATIDEEGYLSLNGERGVMLVATDSPDLNPTGFTYTVSFADLKFDKFNLSYKPFSMELPSGSTVDLASVTPVGSSNGTIIIRGPQGERGTRADEIAPHVRGVTYVAYGHSFGQVQSPINTTAAGLYPTRVRDIAGTDPATFVNNTVSGASMGDIAARAQATWTQGTYGVVTLLGNQNSVGNTHADINAETNFKTAVRSFLNWVRGGTTFPPTVVVVHDTTCTSVGYARYSPPPTDDDVFRFNRYLDDVIAEYPDDGSIIVANALDGWDPATMTAKDGQHPNDRGSAHIAAAIVDALAAADFREGLNYGVAPAPVAPFVVADSFNRADSASTLGMAETGQQWVVAPGATFGVLGSQARTPNSYGENGYAWVESGISDIDLRVVVGSASTVEGLGPVFRLSDVNNTLLVDCQVGVTSGNGMVLYKRVNGSYTALGSTTQTPSTGDIVRVVAVGPSVTVYLNDVQVISATESFNQAATNVGIRVTSSANGVDSIQLTSP